MPVVSQSSENLSTQNETTNGSGDEGSKKKPQDAPTAPPRSSKNGGSEQKSKMKGSKSSFNLDPRPSSGRPSSGRPSSSRPGRYVE